MRYYITIALLFISTALHAQYLALNWEEDIIVYPSDFEDDYYRKDFTHIIWFNN
jgi:hypothetical protein